MTLPEGLLDLIKVSESLRLTAYLCPAGIWTIGYGATGPDIVPGLVWTRQEAEDRLERDAPRYCSATLVLCPSLSGRRLTAVTDFAYNLGTTRLAGSTLRRKINSGNIPGAAEEFEKWVHAGGRILPGLVIRRQTEKALFLSA